MAPGSAGPLPSVLSLQVTAEASPRSARRHGETRVSEIECAAAAGEVEAPAPDEPPLTFPAAVLALLVGLDGERLVAVAGALTIPAAGSRADVAMRVAAEVARDPDGVPRLVAILDAEELRRTCCEVLGLPDPGEKPELVRRLTAWLTLFLPPAGRGQE